MLSYQKIPDKTIVSFSGDLDTVTCIDFEDELFEQIGDSPDKIVFDLKEVKSISSMFLRVCTKVVQKINKENLSIINIPEQPLKVFKLTNLDSFFNISQ